MLIVVKIKYWVIPVFSIMNLKFFLLLLIFFAIYRAYFLGMECVMPSKHSIHIHDIFKKTENKDEEGEKRNLDESCKVQFNSNVWNLCLYLKLIIFP